MQPAAHLIFQPPKPEPFVPVDEHVRMFHAFEGVKETLQGVKSAVRMSKRGQALLIAYMTDELGAKTLAKMAAKEIQEWVVGWKRQNPRVWGFFDQDRIAMLENMVARDGAARGRAPKAVTKWQLEQYEILRSFPVVDDSE